MFGSAVVYFVTLFVFLFNVFLVARVLMSYFADMSNRLFAFLVGITEPIMSPVRQLLPQPSGVDFAPLATFLLLEAIQWLVVHFVPGS
jgi:YggT family protein